MAENTEKKITIGIDVKGRNFNHKAKHAMSYFKRELQKHFRTTNFVISTEINKFIWSKGRVNTPSKVPLIGIEKNAKAYVFLDGSEEDKKKIAELSGKAVKTEEKKEHDKKEEAHPKEENMHIKQKDFIEVKEQNKKEKKEAKSTKPTRLRNK